MRIERPKRFVAICALVGVISGVAVAIVASILFPTMAREQIEKRLVGIEKRYDVSVKISDIVPSGINGAELQNLTVVDNRTERTILTAQRAGASVSLTSLVRGKIVLTQLWAEETEVIATQESDGTFDLVEIASRKSPTSQTDDAPAPTAGSSRLSELFGGTLPQLDATNTSMRFVSVDPQWPLASLSIPTATIASDDPVLVDARVDIVATPGNEPKLPKQTEVHVKVDSDSLQPVGGAITFDRAIRIAKVGPFPFLTAGFSGVSFDESSNVNVEDIVVDFGDISSPPFFAADSLSISLLQWTPRIRNLRINRLAAINPALHDHIDADGRSKMYDLVHMFRPSAPRDVHLSAIRLADQIRRQSDQENSSAPDKDDEPTPVPPDADPSVDPPNRVAQLAEYLPRQIDITNAQMVVRDDRKVELPGWASELQAKDVNVRVSNAIESHRFDAHVSFKAMADNQPRGKVETEFGWDHGNQTTNASIEVDALDLLWFSQLAGPSVANQLRGGKAHASVTVASKQGKTVDFKGTAGLKKLNIFHEKLAEEPVTDFNVSYTFEATYDPNGKIPKPKLLKTATLPDAIPSQSSFRRGSFEVKSGTAVVNGVELSIRPELYGTAALPQLPARVDLDVQLRPTKSQKIFDAIPAAIKGPLDGAQFSGTFAWDLSIEVPLLHANDMVWSSEPKLDRFDIVRLPHAVDVRRAARDMKITIKDTVVVARGVQQEWTKRVYIPTHRQVSSDWIVENMNLTHDQLDSIRRRHPAPANLGQVTSSPAGTEAHTYVRLENISPYLTRAILTTEDKAFWRHPGINFHAMKESFAQNLRARGIKRGGSTIAMQLVKNLFLDRKKLYARKLRETFLVWLMINHVHVPRERLLEIYFNVIEFAPKIYGIHAASAHYFGKKPDELSLGEVAFLVSIIPGPKRYHRMWDRGEIPPYWFRKMSRYIDAMFSNESITEEERDQAQLAAPEFWKPGPGGPAYRPKEEAPPSLNPFDLFFKGRTPEPSESPTTPSPTPQKQPTPVNPPPDTPKTF